MSLARAWRRHLLGASSTALIVPSAMLAAVALLALGGGFGSVGVLGQLFAGPSLPGVGPGAAGGAPAGSRGGPQGLATAALSLVAAVAPAAAPRRAVVHHAPPARTVPISGSGTASAGGAIGGAGGTARPVTLGTGGAGSGGAGGGGLGGGGSGGGGSSPALPPQPSPPPEPTPVETVVKVGTSVTQQLPAQVGPVASQTVQAAGSAVDDLLPQPGQPAPFVPGSPAGR